MSMSGDEAVGALFFGVVFIVILVFAGIGIIGTIVDCNTKDKAEKTCGQYVVKTIYRIDGNDYAICGDDTHKQIK